MQARPREEHPVPDFVGAVDQGTTSTRFMIFDHDGQRGRPPPARARADPAAGRLGRAQPAGDLGAHRDRDRHRADARPASTPATWPRSASPTSARPPWCGTGAPAARYYNAIVWQDTRTDRIACRAGARRQGRRHPRARPACRRPPTSPAARSSGSWRTSTACARRPSAATRSFGNTDTWLLWNLTGGADGGVHVTDVTNASRTMLMDLETLDWDDELLGFFDIPRAMLPRDPAVVRPGRLRRRPAPTARSAARCRSPATSATSRRPPSGQVCFAPGEAKNTYGTGNFMLLNTGTELVRSQARPAHHGLLPVRRRARRSTRWRARSPSPARPCSGCATSSASSRGAAEIEALARAGRRQRRRLLRARVLRAVRAVLALRRPRRDRRAVPVQHQRAPGPGHAGGDLLPEPRRRRGDGAGLRRAPGRAQGRRRRHRQRAVHAAPGRHPRRAGEPAGRRRDDRAGRRLRRRAWRSASGTDTDELRANWNEDRRWDAQLDRRAARGRGTPAGRRRSSAPWTGWTSTDRELEAASTVATAVALSPQAARAEALRRAWPRPSSTSWSSAAAWSAPARALDAVTRGLSRRPGRGARLGQRHVAAGRAS